MKTHLDEIVEGWWATHKVGDYVDIKGLLEKAFRHGVECGLGHASPGMLDYVTSVQPAPLARAVCNASEGCTCPETYRKTMPVRKKK